MNSLVDDATLEISDYYAPEGDDDYDNDDYDDSSVEEDPDEDEE